MSSMVSLYPKHMQLLSLIDIGLHIKERHWGFSIGQMNEFFKNSPLFSWNGILVNKLVEMK
jgi:hypothetical protein